METDLDLSSLITSNDHLNVLRYIRVHQLRQPELVIEHGKYLLGEDCSRKMTSHADDELIRLGTLEQICYAALDCGQMNIAEMCLHQIKSSTKMDLNSIRFRLLVARCYEADSDYNNAETIYNELLQDNPANIMVLKRKYCILKSQVGKTNECITALNNYLQQNYSDTSAWYELAQLYMKMGNYKTACYCYEQILLGAPNNAMIHCELAECYATVGTIDDLLLARKHMCQSLELDPNLLRAQYGLVTIASAYIQQMHSINKKDYNEFEVEVAKELIKYGSEILLKSYENTKLFSTIQKLMNEYTESL